MHHPTDRISHTTAFVTPVVEHWLEREIAQWVHLMKDRSDDPSHHERTLLPLRNMSRLKTKDALGLVKTTNVFHWLTLTQLWLSLNDPYFLPHYLVKCNPVFGYFDPIAWPSYFVTNTTEQILECIIIIIIIIVVVVVLLLFYSL